METTRKEHEGGETAASRALRGPSHTHVQRLDSSTRLNQNLTVLTNSIACRRLPSYICLCLCLHHHHRRRQSHLTAWPEWPVARPPLAYYRNWTYLSAFLFKEIVTVNRTAFVAALESRESTIKACKGNTPIWPSLAPCIRSWPDRATTHKSTGHSTGTWQKSLCFPLT
jgi:hypothetical protein